jgi:diketogulonate reductase-like aldo/keto reductase
MIDTLSDLPLIGLGTWELQGEECVSIIKAALDLGYRHIDTASMYENHRQIGQAIKDFPRQSLFLTSKILLEDLNFTSLPQSIENLCDQYLQDLGTDYIDLMLIHMPDHELAMEKVIFVMESLRDKGKIHHIGVSNFTIHHMQYLLKHEAYFSCNQVEFHPYFFQNELLNFCRSVHVRLIAYRPLGKGMILKDPVICYIAKKIKKTPAQVILRWLIDHEIPTIVKTSAISHLKENLSVFDFSLSYEDRSLIDALSRNIRYCMPDFSEFSF